MEENPRSCCSSPSPSLRGPALLLSSCVTPLLEPHRPPCCSLQSLCTCRSLPRHVPFPTGSRVPLWVSAQIPPPQGVPRPSSAVPPTLSTRTPQSRHLFPTLVSLHSVHLHLNVYYSVILFIKRINNFKNLQYCLSLERIRPGRAWMFPEGKRAGGKGCRQEGREGGRS